MDADFEQHYQAAERAYGLGDYAEAHALASALWDQLESASDKHDPSLVLGWRAVVSLLLGHIQLHGLQQPEQAAISYERVLQGDVDATIAALAEQGLERCRAEDIASKPGMTPATNGAIPDLLKDPFLKTDPDQRRRIPIKPGQHRLTWSPQCRGCPVMKGPGPCRLRIPLPLRLLCQVHSPRSPQKPIHRPRYKNRNQNPLQKNNTTTPSSQRPNPKSLRPRNFWNTHASAFNSSPTSKAPPTPWSRWG